MALELLSHSKILQNVAKHRSIQNLLRIARSIDSVISSLRVLGMSEIC